jgi:DNA-binding transcriptional LysR family regulator
VADRRIDAAFAAEAPGRALAQSLAHVPVFPERLVVISSLDGPPIRRAGDVGEASLIAFPDGCAYRRVLQRWLGADSLAGRRALELGSYHAIVACVAAGAGVAVVPESVLDTMPQANVARHPLPKALAEIRTPLVWRDGEISPPVLALRTLVASLQHSKSGAVKRKSVSAR